MSEAAYWIWSFQNGGTPALIEGEDLSWDVQMEPGGLQPRLTWFQRHFPAAILDVRISRFGDGLLRAEGMMADEAGRRELSAMLEHFAADRGLNLEDRMILAGAFSSPVEPDRSGGEAGAGPRTEPERSAGAALAVPRPLAAEPEGQSEDGATPLNMADSGDDEARNSSSDQSSDGAGLKVAASIDGGGKGQPEAGAERAADAHAVAAVVAEPAGPSQDAAQTPNSDDGAGNRPVATATDFAEGSSIAAGEARGGVLSDVTVDSASDQGSVGEGSISETASMAAAESVENDGEEQPEADAQPEQGGEVAADAVRGDSSSDEGSGPEQGTNVAAASPAVESGGNGGAESDVGAPSAGDAEDARLGLHLVDSAAADDVSGAAISTVPGGFSWEGLEERTGMVAPMRVVEPGDDTAKAAEAREETPVAELGSVAAATADQRQDAAPPVHAPDSGSAVVGLADRAQDAESDAEAADAERHEVSAAACERSLEDPVSDGRAPDAGELGGVVAAAEAREETPVAEPGSVAAATADQRQDAALPLHAPDSGSAVVGPADREQDVESDAGAADAERHELSAAACERSLEDPVSDGRAPDAGELSGAVGAAEAREETPVAAPGSVAAATADQRQDAAPPLHAPDWGSAVVGLADMAQDVESDAEAADAERHELSVAAGDSSPDGGAVPEGPIPAASWLQAWKQREDADTEGEAGDPVLLPDGGEWSADEEQVGTPLQPSDGAEDLPLASDPACDEESVAALMRALVRGDLHGDGVPDAATESELICEIPEQAALTVGGEPGANAEDGEAAASDADSGDGQWTAADTAGDGGSAADDVFAQGHEPAALPGDGALNGDVPMAAIAAAEPVGNGEDRLDAEAETERTGEALDPAALAVGDEPAGNVEDAGAALPDADFGQEQLSLAETVGDEGRDIEAADAKAQEPAALSGEGAADEGAAGEVLMEAAAAIAAEPVENGAEERLDAATDAQTALYISEIADDRSAVAETGREEGSNVAADDVQGHPPLLAAGDSSSGEGPGIEEETGVPGPSQVAGRIGSGGEEQPDAEAAAELTTLVPELAPRWAGSEQDSGEERATALSADSGGSSSQEGLAAEDGDGGDVRQVRETSEPVSVTVEGAAKKKRRWSFFSFLRSLKAEEVSPACPDDPSFVGGPDADEAGTPVADDASGEPAAAQGEASAQEGPAEEEVSRVVAPIDVAERNDNGAGEPNDAAATTELTTGAPALAPLWGDAESAKASEEVAQALPSPDGAEELPSDAGSVPEAENDGAAIEACGAVLPATPDDVSSDEGSPVDDAGVSASGEDAGGAGDRPAQALQVPGPEPKRKRRWSFFAFLSSKPAELAGDPAEPVKSADSLDDRSAVAATAGDEGSEIAPEMPELAVETAESAPLSVAAEPADQSEDAGARFSPSDGPGDPPPVAGTGREEGRNTASGDEPGCGQSATDEGMGREDGQGINAIAAMAWPDAGGEGGHAPAAVPEFETAAIELVAQDNVALIGHSQEIPENLRPVHSEEDLSVVAAAVDEGGNEMAMGSRDARRVITDSFSSQRSGGEDVTVRRVDTGEDRREAARKKAAEPATQAPGSVADRQSADVGTALPPAAPGRGTPLQDAENAVRPEPASLAQRHATGDARRVITDSFSSQRSGGEDVTVRREAARTSVAEEKAKLAAGSVADRQSADVGAALPPAAPAGSTSLQDRENAVRPEPASPAQRHATGDARRVITDSFSSQSSGGGDVTVRRGEDRREAARTGAAEEPATLAAGSVADRQSADVGAALPPAASTGDGSPQDRENAVLAAEDAARQEAASPAKPHATGEEPQPREWEAQVQRPALELVPESENAEPVRVIEEIAQPARPAAPVAAENAAAARLRDISERVRSHTSRAGLSKPHSAASYVPWIDIRVDEREPATDEDTVASVAVQGVTEQRTAIAAEPGWHGGEKPTATAGESVAEAREPVAKAGEPVAEAQPPVAHRRPMPAVEPKPAPKQQSEPAPKMETLGLRLASVRCVPMIRSQDLAERMHYFCFEVALAMDGGAGHAGEQVTLSDIPPDWSSLIVDVEVLSFNLHFGVGAERKQLQIMRDGTCVPAQFESVVMIDGRRDTKVIEIAAMFSHGGRFSGHTRRTFDLAPARG